MSVSLLETKRQLEARRTEIQEEAKRLDAAITALVNLTAKTSHAPSSVGAGRARVGVKTMMLRLLGEEDRDWSVNEIIVEYTKRKTPVQGKSPSNSLRAAIAESYKAGQVFRTTTGRYKASKWRQLPE